MRPINFELKYSNENRILSHHSRPRKTDVRYSGNSFERMLRTFETIKNQKEIENKIHVIHVWHFAHTIMGYLTPSHVSKFFWMISSTDLYGHIL